MSINGVILINKPLNITSYQVIRELKRLLGLHKYGHTGTLDPLASGMLAICVNRATKAAALFVGSSKVYTAEIQLGTITPTGDSEGPFKRVCFVNDTHLALLTKVTSIFRGFRWQTPPMYSALKIRGQRLYQLARQNKNIVVPPRPIVIYALQFLAFNPASYTLLVRIHCSKGTYIRTLAEDIGTFLGCGAYLRSLHRNTIGTINETWMVTLQALESLPPLERLQHLHPVSTFFPDVILRPGLKSAT